MNTQTESTSGARQETDFEPGVVEMLAPAMSLRDFFAAQAMAGDWAAPGDASLVTSGKSTEEVARRYYVMADAMLKVRNEPGESK